MASRKRHYLGSARRHGLATQGEQQFPAPTKVPVNTPRFLIPAGTKVGVRNVFRDEWVTHTTRQDNGFERFERWVKDAGGPYYEFRSEVGGWVMLVAARFVRHRR